MSNILERHLEQNIEPTGTKQDYIDQAIQIFTDMKPEDIITSVAFKHGNKYCLCGLFSRMTGWKSYDDGSLCFDATDKLGEGPKDRLSGIHISYCWGSITFEQMRQQAIQYMESLKQ